jgi:hypothetical protein
VPPDGLQLVGEKLRSLTEELNTWSELTASADYR